MGHELAKQIDLLTRNWTRNPNQFATNATAQFPITLESRHRDNNLVTGTKLECPGRWTSSRGKQKSSKSKKNIKSLSPLIFFLMVRRDISALLLRLSKQLTNLDVIEFRLLCNWIEFASALQYFLFVQNSLHSKCSAFLPREVLSVVGRRLHFSSDGSLSRFSESWLL